MTQIMLPALVMCLALSACDQSVSPSTKLPLGVTVTEPLPPLALPPGFVIDPDETPTTPTITITSSDDGDSWPPVTCGRPCVVESSSGGSVDLFTAYGRQLQEEGVPLIIDGPCYSSCTIMVDMNYKNVCVTTDAVFGYHKWTIKDKTGKIIKEGDITYQTPGLEAYIQSKGGLPDPKEGDLLLINFEEAKQFYKPCDGAK